MSNWTFLSNHAQVFILLCGDPDLRMRDIARRVEITERAVQRIVRDLVEDGYLEICKSGRRNHYEANLDARLRHPLEAGISVRCLVTAIYEERTIEELIESGDSS